MTAVTTLTSPADIALHDQITANLQQAHIDAVANHDYLDELNGNLLTPLDRFPKNGFGTFADAATETQKNDLIQAIDSFLHEISYNNKKDSPHNHVTSSQPVNAKQKVQDLAAAYQSFAY